MQSIACASYNSRSIGNQCSKLPEDVCKVFRKGLGATDLRLSDPLEGLERIGIALRIVDKEQFVNIQPSYNRLKYNLQLIGIEVIDMDTALNVNVDFILEITLNNLSTEQKTASNSEINLLLRAQGKRDFCPVLGWKYSNATGRGLHLAQSYQTNIGNFFSNFLIDYGTSNEKRIWHYDNFQEKVYILDVPD